MPGMSDNVHGNLATPENRLHLSRKHCCRLGLRHNRSLHVCCWGHVDAERGTVCRTVQTVKCGRSAVKCDGKATKYNSKRRLRSMKGVRGSLLAIGEDSLVSVARH